MKKTMKTISLAILLLIGGKALQAQKIGHVHLDSLVYMLPEAAKADSNVLIEGKKWEIALVKQQEKVQSLLDTIQNIIAANGGKEPSNDPFYQLYVGDYQNASERLNKLNQDAQNAVAVKRQKEYEPLIDKVKKAIAEIAKEKGYTYVLDNSAGSILYAPQADNLNADVRKKLGIK